MSSLIPESAAPLIERILSEPISFKPARNPDKVSVRPSSYISLNGAPKTLAEPQNQVQENVQEKLSENAKTKPKSMAEAVAAYTGKRFLTRTEKRKEKLLRRESNKRQLSKETVISFSDNDDDTGVDVEESVSADEFAGFQTAEEDEKEEEGKEEEGEENTSRDFDDKAIISKIELKKQLKDDLSSPNTSADEENAAPRPSVSSPTKRETTPPTSPENEEVNCPIDTTDFFEIDEWSDDRGSNGSKRIVKNWKNLKQQKPLGLVNHGVTCYMNSAIQALIHIPALQHYLLQVYGHKHPSISPRSVTADLAALTAKMWQLEKMPKKPLYINPKRLIKRLDDINCMMSEWQQEDSHEYFMSLMSRLQEDSTPKGVKLNESIIYDIFGGLLQQVVHCQKCDNVSKTQQEFYDLSVGLDGKKRKNQPQVEKEEIKSRYSIQNSLRDFFSPELIRRDKKDDSTGYFCEHCKERTNGMKKSTIDRAPEALAIHLKRFRFNGTSSSKVKAGVGYPSLLDLTPFTTDGKSATLYRLCSVIVHEGRSISSGHYIAHCRQPDGTWETYDDEYINRISEKQVLKDQSAYVLVYTRLTHKDVTKKRSADEERSSNMKKVKKA